MCLTALGVPSPGLLSLLICYRGYSCMFIFISQSLALFIVKYSNKTFTIEEQCGGDRRCASRLCVSPCACPFKILVTSSGQIPQPEEIRPHPPAALSLGRRNHVRLEGLKTLNLWSWLDPATLCSLSCMVPQTKPCGMKLSCLRLMGVLLQSSPLGLPSPLTAFSLSLLAISPVERLLSDS